MYLSMRNSVSIEVNQLHVSKSLSFISIIFQVSHMLYPKYAVPMSLSYHVKCLIRIKLPNQKPSAATSSHKTRTKTNLKKTRTKTLAGAPR